MKALVDDDDDDVVLVLDIIFVVIIVVFFLSVVHIDIDIVLAVLPRRYNS